MLLLLHGISERKKVTATHALLQKVEVPLEQVYCGLQTSDCCNPKIHVFHPNSSVIPL